MDKSANLLACKVDLIGFSTLEQVYTYIVESVNIFLGFKIAFA